LTLTQWNVLGLRYEAIRRSYSGASYTGPPTFVCRDLYVPLWQLLLPALATPLVIAAHIARRRRGVRAGLCPSCGYDLRASPDRCPECGTFAATRGTA
jgi:hypothetical protein